MRKEVIAYSVAPYPTMFAKSKGCRDTKYFVSTMQILDIP